MNIKMSEEFALPLYSSGSGNIKDRTMSNTLLRLAVFPDFASSEAACHAINNHDRLASENARLREALLKSNEAFRDNLSMFAYKNEGAMYECYTRNEQLLTEMEK